MIRGLLPRIIRFRRCSKGVSTVIGTIFLVLIALTVATNVFLWTLTQNATYNQAVKESNQMEAERFDERIVAYDTIYSVSPDEVEVTTTMVAQGALSAKIITVWVTCTNETDTKYNSTMVDFNLTPGDSITRTINVNVPGALLDDGVCNGWLVTARGNLIALEEKKAISTANVSHGIGSIMMDLNAFQYYYYASSNVLTGYPDDGSKNFSVPSETPVAFGVFLTNYDEGQEPIMLDSSCMLWALFPATGSQPRGASWYIVNVDGNRMIAPQYSEIRLDYGVRTLLIFASETMGSFDPSGTDKVILSPNIPFPQPAAINLLLHGYVGEDDYGQNIPFVSLYFTDD